MNKTKRVLLNGVFLLIAAVISAVITQNVTRSNIENSSIEMFDMHFELVTINMQYGQAIDAILEETNRLRREVNALAGQQVVAAQDYQSQLSDFKADVSRLELEVSMLEEQISVAGQNLGENLEQIREYRSRISDLEEETANLRAEIDIFIARGEAPIPRGHDGRPAIITRLADETTIQNNFHHTDTHRDNYRYEYSDVVILRRGQTFRTLLDGRYTRLRGTIFIAYGETNHRTTTIRIEREGMMLISHNMDRTTRPIQIDIDLTGVNQFSITTDGDSNWQGPLFPYVHFAYFRLYP